VGWLLSLLPILFVGGSPIQFLKLPFVQTQEFKVLAIGVANPWEGANFIHFPFRAGLFLGLFLTAATGLFIIWLGQREGAAKPYPAAALAALSLLFMPYVMPEMHDRYFFAAEVFLSVLACVDFRFLAPAGLVLSSSLINYVGYFLSITRHSAVVFGVVATTIALLIVTRHVLRLCFAGQRGWLAGHGLLPRWGSDAG
jgi:hypothetical protein